MAHHFKKNNKILSIKKKTSHVYVSTISPLNYSTYGVYTKKHRTQKEELCPTLRKTPFPQLHLHPLNIFPHIFLSRKHTSKFTFPFLTQKTQQPIFLPKTGKYENNYSEKISATRRSQRVVRWLGSHTTLRSQDPTKNPSLPCFSPPSVTKINKNTKKGIIFAWHRGRTTRKKIGKCWLLTDTGQ